MAGVEALRAWIPTALQRGSQTLEELIESMPAGILDEEDPQQIRELFQNALGFLEGSERIFVQNDKYILR